ncbi:MAG: GNAT family N-acetyltransferase [Gammaproteobacteria bacterium]
MKKRLIKIRQAMPGESDALSQLALRAKAHWGYPDESMRQWRDELLITADAIQQRPTFVVDGDSGPAAVLQIESRTEPWEIECLWVHPDAMRSGYGTALVRHAASYARHNGQTRLAIDADPNAEAFYVALGACRTGKVEAPLSGQPDRFRPQLLMDT